MAEGMTFHFTAGNSVLHKTDTIIKIIAMVSLSLLLISISIFRLIMLFPVVLLLHISLKAACGKIRISPLLLIMPLIIFAGNAVSIYLIEGSDLLFGLVTASLRTFRFVLILWMAHLFTATTEPLTITPALYRILKSIPFLPAARISTQAGLSLVLIPLILDEMSEIRDAMKSRCGWKRTRPVRNLFHMGLPLLEGVLKKAESLSDAMESRIYNEEATEPEFTALSDSLLPIILLIFLLALILSCEGILGDSLFFKPIMRFY